MRVAGSSGWGGVLRDLGSNSPETGTCCLACRRVANARKSFYADTAMRSSLCKDMGSFCKALQEAFQNSRAADAYCVEFMTDALRLALQHERQDLPFRMTIFSELCYHARRHDFVFDTLLSLAEQCR